MHDEHVRLLYIWQGELGRTTQEQRERKQNKNKEAKQFMSQYDPKQKQMIQTHCSSSKGKKHDLYITSKEALIQLDNILSKTPNQEFLREY